MKVYNSMNKPILLHPVGKDYLWGGRRLHDEYGKNIDLFPLAETWECSTHPDGTNIIANGEFSGMALSDVIKKHPDFLGKKNEGLDELPILVKLIDAKDDLSVQVHPHDKYAMEHENGELGKTEMWYVLEATKDSKLIYGFNHDCNADELRSDIFEGKLLKHLQQIPVKKDDVFFIEAGMVHAIGAGTLVAEIQENSNLTYRLFDYNRVDKNGHHRELHIDKAMDVMNMKSSLSPKQPIRVLKYSKGMASELLCRCKYFEVFRMIVHTELRQIVKYRTDEMNYRVLMCIDGCGVMRFENESIDIYKGDCFFFPANSVEVRLHGQMQLLDVRG